MSKTLFQRICDHEIPARIAYEDDQVVAFHDIQPQAPVHVLVVPREPISRLAETSPQHQQILGLLLLKAAHIAVQLGVAQTGYRLVINNGRDGGESVPHLHCHLLGGRPLSWPPG